MAEDQKEILSSVASVAENFVVDDLRGYLGIDLFALHQGRHEG